MSTTSALDDGFDDAERGLEWLEKLEALQARSASEQAAYEVAEYVMKLRAAVAELAGDRTASELSENLGTETAQLVEEVRQAGGRDYWDTRIRPALLKSNSGVEQTSITSSWSFPTATHAQQSACSHRNDGRSHYWD